MKRSKRAMLLAGLALVGVAAMSIGAWALLSPQAREQRNWHRFQAYSRAGKYPEAVIALQNILQVNPRSAQAYLQLGRAYLLLRDPRRAVSAFSQATALDPSLLDAQVALGDLLYIGGRVDLAYARAQLVVRKEPSNRQALVLLAQSAAGLGRWEESIHTLEGLLARDPSVADVHLLLGSALLHKKNVELAVSHLQRAAALAPKDARPYYGLGIADELLKQDGKAITEFENALSRDLNMVAALWQIAVIDWKRGDRSGAIARVERQIERSPKNVELRNLLGFIYMASGDAANAQQTFAQAIQVNPQLPASYLLLGASYQKSRLYELAARKFEEALKVDPANVIAHLELGIVRDAQGQHEQARDYYEKAVARDPTLAPALNNLAWYYVEVKGDLDTAQRYAALALARAPHNPHILDTQGWIWYKRGRYDEAVRYLSESAQSLATQPLILYHLGMAYLGQGRKDLAKQELQAALRLSQEFPGASDAKKALLILQ